jgi:hypothetical protein
MQSSVSEQADPNLALDVIRTCGKQLYRKQWQEDRTLEQSALKLQLGRRSQKRQQRLSYCNYAIPTKMSYCLISRAKLPSK